MYDRDSNDTDDIMPLHTSSLVFWQATLTFYHLASYVRQIFDQSKPFPPTPMVMGLLICLCSLLYLTEHHHHATANLPLFRRMHRQLPLKQDHPSGLIDFLLHIWYLWYLCMIFLVLSTATKSSYPISISGVCIENLIPKIGTIEIELCSWAKEVLLCTLSTSLISMWSFQGYLFKKNSIVCVYFWIGVGDLNT